MPRHPRVSDTCPLWFDERGREDAPAIMISASASKSSSAGAPFMNRFTSPIIGCPARSSGETVSQIRSVSLLGLTSMERL